MTESKEEEECNICLIKLSDKTISCCQCKQKFHLGCLKEWYTQCLKSQKDVSCPNCRHVHTFRPGTTNNTDECCGNTIFIVSWIQSAAAYTEEEQCKEEHIHIIQEIVQEENSKTRNHVFKDNSLNGILVILSTFLCFSFGIIGLISTAAIELDED